MSDVSLNPIDRAAKESFGIDYLFPYQRLVVSNILDGMDQIVILPTGAGKSLCFAVPAAFFDGPTLIVFPLLALMADQARRLKDTGLGVGILRGGQSRAERDSVWRDCRSGALKYLIANPEILLQPAVLPRLKDLGISHMVIDEAHTVSEWGDSFRPSYLRIPEIRREAEIPQVSAFTATASEYILKRLREIIFTDSVPHLVQAVPDRPNIAYSVVPVLSKDRALRELVRSVDRPAIVFCRSRTSAELAARMISRTTPAIDCRFYHAGLERDEKKQIEEWFFSSEDGVLASTCAYGMGVDKSNIRTVIHRSLPPSVEAYLQESGRAGRDRGQSEAILLFGAEDLASEGKGEMEEIRYKAMVRYAVSGKVCRRAFLLSLLSAEPEVCFGCDVCRGNAASVAKGASEILRFAARNPRTFAAEDAAKILSGWRGGDTIRRRLHLVSGFGDLDGWLPDETEQAIASLVRLGLLRVPIKGPWKRTIALSSEKSYRRARQTRLRLNGSLFSEPSK